MPGKFLTVLFILAASIRAGDGICLVLSGGGARGLAHIGVLRALEEEGVRIDALAGTSMGALVGGLYACGWSAIQIDSIASTIDWDLLFSGAPRKELTSLPQRLAEEGDILTLSLRGLSPVLPPGAFSTLRVSALLVSLTGFRQVSSGPEFDSLPIPMRVVSFDLVGGRRVVHSRGNLARALLASMAIPSVFPAVREGESLLVDGGVVDNMPVDVARSTWDMPVLAVDVSSPPAAVPDEPSLLQTGTLTLDALTSSLNALNFQEADFTLRPDLGSARAWSFGDAESLVALGYEAARSFLEEHPEIPRGRASHYSWHPEPLVLHDLLLGGLERFSPSSVFPWIPLSRGDTLAPATIREVSEILCASGLFSRVEPEIRRSASIDGAADLIFNLTERDPSSIGLGLTYGSDIGLDGRITIRNANFLNSGRRFVLSTGGGDDYVFGEATFQDQRLGSRWFQQLLLTGWQMSSTTYDREGWTGTEVMTQAEGELATGLSLGWFGLTQAGIRAVRHASTSGDEGSWTALFLRGLTRTLDDPENPSRGSRLRAELAVDLFEPGQIGELDYLVAAQLARRVSFTFEGMGQVCSGDVDTWQYSRFDAAFPMPGYPWNSMPARERISGAFTLTRRLRGPFFLALRGAASWDWETLQDMGEGEAVYGAGVSFGVRTPAGPATISWGIGLGARQSWTVTIGAPESFGPGR
jgi:NTE family protein